MLAPLRVGLAGAGHFGRYHALKVVASPRAVLVGIHDHNLAHAAALARETGAPAFSLPDLIAASDAIIVAVPAAAHRAIAAPALGAGRHVLVEKPIATTLADADHLASLATRHGCILQVGHLERFSAAHAALTSRAGMPLYLEATRAGTFKTRGTDVSVVLDLMIHDLDLILVLIDSGIESVDAVGAPIASAQDDIANARIRFASGAVASITASRVAPRTERRMRIFGPSGYLAIDFANRRLTLTRRGHGDPVASLPGFGAEHVSWQDHDALAAEQAAFFAAILDGAPVMVDAEAGRRALAAALAVSKAIAASRARMAATGLIQQRQYSLGGCLGGH
jgi:predicted dehydrogenase